MKIVYFNDYTLGVLKGDAVVDVLIWGRTTSSVA